MKQYSAMTALHIQMLLHYYAVATPYAENAPDHARSFAVEEYRLQLIDWHMLVRKPNSESGYAVTERARCFIDHILNLPLPIQKTTWSMP